MKGIKSFLFFIVFLLVIATMSANAATLPLMRAMSSGGDWGGNIEAFQNGIPDAYIQYLLDDNVNWVGIKVSIFNKTISDPTVEVIYRPSGNNETGKMYTYDDNDLINAITKFKENGINVYLAFVMMQHLYDQSSTCNTAQYGVDPHIIGDSLMPSEHPTPWWGSDCVDPSLWWWNPSHPDHAANVATFWETYTQVAVKYAKIAEQYGVGMFALAEEMERLFRTRTTERFTNNFRNELTQLVSAVRAEYNGLLTYGQQSLIYQPNPEADGFEKEASSSLFTDLGLDVVGISAAWQYEIALDYNVSDPRLHSVAEFEDGWTSVFNDYLVPLQADNPNIPIIFSDFAAPDAVNAESLNEPFVFTDSNENGIDDGQEQRSNFFQALLNVNSSFNYLLRGIVFVWYLVDTDQTLSQATRNLQFHGKPAEEVIRNAYAGWAALGPTIDSFTQTSATLQDTVTITGTNFTGATAVSFGGTAARSFTVDSSTGITAIVNFGSTGDISVTTSYGTGTKSGFIYIPPIPTLREWGILIFTVLILLSGMVMLRKKGMI